MNLSESLKPFVPAFIAGSFLIGCLSLLAIGIIFGFNTLLNAKIEPLKENQVRLEKKIDEVKSGLEKQIDSLKEDMNRQFDQLMAKKIARK